MLKRMMVCAALVGMLASVLRGQALVESVPPDAIVYIGWQGAGAMPAEYDQSHLKAMAEASQFRQLFTESLPRLAKLIEREEPEAAPVMAALAAIVEPMWQHPTAIYFGGVDLTNPDRPMPRLAALIHAGDQAPALAAKLQQEIVKLGPAPIPVTAAEAGGVVALVVGQLPQPADAQASLAQEPKFTAALAKVRKEGVVHVYIDTEALWEMIDQLIEAYQQPDDQQTWIKIRDALHLNGIQRMAYSGSFDGRDWREDIYVQAPAPRRGLAALGGGQPLTGEILSAIPQDATLAMAFQVDLGRIMQEVRSAIQQADADTARKMEEGLAQINDKLELDLERDLLEPLGHQWALYTAQSVGGDGLMGLCIVNRLDNAAKVEQALWQLSRLANDAMKDVGDGEITLAFKEFERDGLKVQYFAIPFVSPSWAVKDGNLYIGLYPQVVVAAANHVSSKGSSITDNPKFQAVRQRLGVENALGIEFYDLEQRVPAGYASTLVFMRLYLGIGDLMGMQTPAMVMPPLNVIMQRLSPAGGASWADDDGFYARYIQPFPGSTNLATSDVTSALVGQQAMMVSILLPSLNRARETANRVKCASNMRQIGQAMLLYSNENRRQYPPDLGTLVTTQDISPEVFACPSSSTSLPAAIRGAAPAQQAAWVNENAAYVYLLPPGTTMNLNPEIVVLHERLDNHDHDGMNLLFADGHVEFMNMPAAQREIEKSKRELARRSPQR